MYKRLNLLSIKPNTSKTTIIIIAFLLFLLFISIIFKVYSSFKVTGVVTCEDKCYIETNLPVSKSKIINKKLNIVYENREYEVKEVFIENIIDNSNDIYLKIKLDTSLELEKNNIIDFKIIYDKQRIITKIKNIMKG